MGGGLLGGSLAANGRRLWERLPGESRQAYHAFTIYRDMQGERSYTLVARTVPCSRPLIGRWGSKWRWQRRLEAYLRYQEEQRLVQEAQAIREMNTRQADLAMQIQERVRERLQTLDPNLMSLDSAAKLLAIAFQTERLARGLSATGETAKSSTRTEATFLGPEEVGGIVGERIAALTTVDRDLLRRLSQKHLRILQLEAGAHMENEEDSSDIVGAHLAHLRQPNIIRRDRPRTTLTDIVHPAKE